MGNTINLADAVLESGLTTNPHAASAIAIAIVRICAHTSIESLELLTSITELAPPQPFLDKVKYGNSKPDERTE